MNEVIAPLVFLLWLVFFGALIGGLVYLAVAA